MKVFLVSGSSKDVGTLFSALTRRLDTVKKSLATSFSSANKETSKRKMSEEHKEAVEATPNDGGDDDPKPPPEKEAKIVQ